MKNDPLNYYYAEISSIKELRLQKDRLRKKVEMQEELISAGTGRVKEAFHIASLVGNFFSGVSRYTAVLSLAYAAFKAYKKHKKRSIV